MNIEEKDKDLTLEVKSPSDDNMAGRELNFADVPDVDNSSVTSQYMDEDAPVVSDSASDNTESEKIARLAENESTGLNELEVEENKIRIISPGRMVLKRFFRSRLSVIGLVTLIVLFAFAIFGPFFSSWGETEADLRPTPVYSMDYPIEYTEMIETDAGILEAAFYTLGSAYVKVGGETSASEIKDAIAASSPDNLKEVLNKNLFAMYSEFEESAASFDIDGHKVYFEIEFREGMYSIYMLSLNEGANPLSTNLKNFSRVSTELVRRTRNSRTLNLNDVPTKDHWLGTDSGAYDVFTRLMYAGRISLTLGFVVVFISAFIGIFMGGIAGYFGKWVDLIVMRIIDIIYCLPQLPIMLIISAILDGLNVNEGLRIYYLMALLSLMGWAGVARVVRGQILTLREQEFMVAAEALGISIPRRIVKHLVPNVMPVLIVSMTLALGGTILTEATLSFLGLGVRPPKAAWGTMISSANDPLILQYYPNQWVPAGVMIVLAVLAFNFVGDGLRDAFDPKMKR